MNKKQYEQLLLRLARMRYDKDSLDSVALAYFYLIFGAIIQLINNVVGWFILFIGIFYIVMFIWEEYKAREVTKKIERIDIDSNHRKLKGWY